MKDFLFSCIDSNAEHSRSLYGQFQIGPFRSGQAVTIVNTLRRALLSELYGLAITAVQIEGVIHEYSTITGLRESVLDLLLNVKQIVLTSNFQTQEPQIALLEVRGPLIVRASDIKLPLSVQCVDSEQYLATLLYDGILKIKFLICRGKDSIVQNPRGFKYPKSVLDATPSTFFSTKAFIKSLNNNEPFLENQKKVDEVKKREKNIQQAYLANRAIREELKKSKRNVKFEGYEDTKGYEGLFKKKRSLVSFILKEEYEDTEEYEDKPSSEGYEGYEGYARVNGKVSFKSFFKEKAERG